MNIHDEKILILDFGSQTTQLIARRIREQKVYCEIHPFNVSIDRIRAIKPKGIILSGGPSSVYDQEAPKSDPRLFDLAIPVLGICYGVQLMTQQLGGWVEKAEKREFGKATLDILDESGVFAQLGPGGHQVWMSHGDRIEALPPDFFDTARSDSSPHAAIRHHTRPLYGVQFHPEVSHTLIGQQILANFIFHICGCTPSWTMHSFVKNVIAVIKEQVGNERVVCGLSGGVDSTVVAALIHRAIGDRLTCIFVDNGLLRARESDTVLTFFRDKTGLNVVGVDASVTFLSRLRGVTDPEKKRKIIGTTFIEVFEAEARKVGDDAAWLAQGTLYPDVIESVSFKGPSAVIKSHHNVGGLPEIMKLKLLEPLRELFKDEVRLLGLELQLPEEAVFRHPFPGPGLAIRVLGEVTEERLHILRQADAIVIEEMKKSGWYNKVWQSFAVLLPIKTVGVMGDERTYENVCALRVVDSKDAMTADWTRLPYDLLGTISNRIINEVRGINRVALDISSKPPGTIEWE